MVHDIFISYSSKDDKMADAVCRNLESNGLKCWIAPRNIISGKNYAEQIMQGIKLAKIIVLVFSKDSQESVFVNNEIDAAFSNDKPIISFKIDETLPEKKMEFFLKNKHWLDAYPNPEKLFDRLVRDAAFLCEEVENEGKANPFYTQFEDDTSKLEKKLKSKDEAVVDVVEMDNYPESDSDKEIIKDSKTDSSKDKVKDSKKDSDPKTSSVKDSKVAKSKPKKDSAPKTSSVKDSKVVESKPKKESTSKTSPIKDSKVSKSKPKKDLKPQRPGSSNGAFSDYKIPIIIGAVLLLVVIGGIIVFSGGGGVVETNTTNSSDVGIEIDYVGIAGDGESYYVYGSIPPELGNSSKSVIHVDFYDDSGKVIKSDKTKLKNFDGKTLDACLVGKQKVSKVVVELRDAKGNVLSSAESDKIK